MKKIEDVAELAWKHYNAYQNIVLTVKVVLSAAILVSMCYCGHLEHIGASQAAVTLTLAGAAALAVMLLGILEAEKHIDAFHYDSCATPVAGGHKRTM